MTGIWCFFLCHHFQRAVWLAQTAFKSELFKTYLCTLLRGREPIRNDRDQLFTECLFIRIRETAAER